MQVAATESPARMTAAAKAIAATIRPDLFEEQARAASDERTVRLYDLELGQARLIVDGPAPLIHAVYDRLTAMGRAVLAVPALADEVPDAAAFSTDAANLCEFCRRHHILKHHTGWRVRQLGHGVVEWVGPTGRRYLDRPPAMVRFVPSAFGDAPF